MATSLAGLSGTLRTGSLRISLSGASRRKRSLLRHDRACRRLKLNRTIPVDSSPHARGPSRTPSSRRAAPEPSRQESTGVELRAEPPQSRLGPAPEPLPSCASLRTGKLDSCRLLSIRLGVGLARNSTPVESLMIVDEADELLRGNGGFFPSSVSIWAASPRRRA